MEMSHAKKKLITPEIVIFIYNQLMQNTIHQGLHNYLGQQYYYDTIHEILQECYNESYSPEGVRKLINAHFKKKNGAITLKIISMYKKWDGVEPEKDLINRIREKVPCMKEYIQHVIKSI
jgi:hypothetical protein